MSSNITGAIVDVIRVLADSQSPTAYWRKLKQRLKEEGNETVTNCHALKLISKDGKRRMNTIVTGMIESVTREG